MIAHDYKTRLKPSVCNVAITALLANAAMGFAPKQALVRSSTEVGPYIARHSHGHA